MAIEFVITAKTTSWLVCVSVCVRILVTSSYFSCVLPALAFAYLYAVSMTRHLFFVFDEVQQQPSSSRSSGIRFSNTESLVRNSSCSRCGRATGLPDGCISSIPIARSRFIKDPSSSLSFDFEFLALMQLRVNVGDEQKILRRWLERKPRRTWKKICDTIAKNKASSQLRSERINQIILGAYISN